MFVTRLISGIVLVVLALITILSGGFILFGTTLVLSLIAIFELYRAVGLCQKEKGVLFASGLAGVILYYAVLLCQNWQFIMFMLVAVLILMLGVYVFAYPKYTEREVALAFFGLIYTAVLLSFIYQTRILPRGNIIIWLIFLCSWGCDTCAYCIGMLFGKHKMAPVLSPKKSIEGAAGGVIGSMLLGVLYAFAVHEAIWEYALICGAGAFISMIGDLAASAIKRNEGIKDYGKLIPGHGGILDRFDSVIFTAPAVYILAVLLHV